MNNALTYMLLLPTDDYSMKTGVSTVVLPSWPCEWDVDFKLHAPGGLVVEGQVVNGNASVTVTPPERRNEVTVRACQHTASRDM